MMPKKYISTYYGHGYSPLPGIDLVITNTGVVAYDGVRSKYGGSITNDGHIKSEYRFSDGGIFLYNGGSVTNGLNLGPFSYIKGRTGVTASAGYGVVNNYGYIGGINSKYGFGDGIDFEAGGRVRNNGDLIQSQSGLIKGDVGVSVNGGVGEIYNSGWIYGAAKPGVALYDGGSLETVRYIKGEDGVFIQGAAGSVANRGTIIGQASSGRGVVLEDGGAVVNNNILGTIEGGDGVFVSGNPAYVYNAGAIIAQSVSGFGVSLGRGGTVTNTFLGTDYYLPLIQGPVGLFIDGGTGTVTNTGTIHGTSGYGVLIEAGGTLTNGSPSQTRALMEGSGGVYLYGPTQASNFGTISGTGDGGSGVHLSNGASVTNGAAGHTAGLIEGYIGVNVYFNAATVTNFGTIIGTGGTAVSFAAATDVLNVGAGSSFVGAVLGADGTLDLLSGTGTISGLFAAGGNVTISGSVATTTFQNFGRVVISAGAAFADSGKVTIAAGQTVDDAGTLDLSATAKNANTGLIETTGGGVLTIAGPLLNSGAGRLVADGGTLVVSGAVTGAGVAMIDGGTLDLASRFNEAVAFTGTTGALDLARSKIYAASITGFSNSGGTSLDLGDIGFVASTEATFSGTKRSGVLTVTDGRDIAHVNLKGNFTHSTFIASSDGHGGTVVVDSTARDTAIAPSSAKFIDAMAGFGAPAADGQLHASQAWSDRMPGLAKPRVAAV